MIYKKINNLALDIQKTPNRYWLNIMEQEKNGTYYWVIAGFDYNEEEDCYVFKSVGDRIKSNLIDWYDLGCLIKLGYTILNNKDLKKLYNEGE